MKKKFKAEIISELRKTNSLSQPQTAVKVVEPTFKTEEKLIEPLPESQIEASQTKKDLKKTALIIGSLVIILLIIYFTNTKTSWLNQFADTLAKILNIQ